MQSTKTFSDLRLLPQLQQTLERKGYRNPTPIQAQAIPGLLEGRDLIGIAQTGTGKTAAFTLPILQQMKPSNPRVVQTLILAPTRELATQIGESFATYGTTLPFKHTLIFGGVPPHKQIRELRKGVDIIIATPGRLLDLLRQRKINLKHLRHFVLDEADHMLDMGFIHDIKKIIAQLPEKRQSLFFSATMSEEATTLANTLLTDPIRVRVTPQTTPIERITQHLLFVDTPNKDALLLHLFKEESFEKVLIFTRTKHKANKVATVLNKNGFHADAIHGNKSQGARDKTIRDFKKGVITVLVATDIAARGIDIKQITHVINYELPNEPESYVHRIGRTARAGTTGIAYSFCAADERNYSRDIEQLINIELPVMDHLYYSQTAEQATGAAAKPKKRTGRPHKTRRQRKAAQGNGKNKRSFSSKRSGTHRNKSRNNRSRGNTRFRAGR